MQKILIEYLERLYAENKDYREISIRKFKKGEMLLYKDEQAEHIYIVRKGGVKCYITEENGKDYMLDLLGEGSFIGDIELLYEIPNVGSIEAFSYVEVFQLTNAFFMRLIETDVQFTRLLLKEMARRISNTSTRASYQQLYPLKYSVIRLVLEFDQMDLHLSKVDLASFLGISIRSLNRVLKELLDVEYMRVDPELGILPWNKPKLQGILDDYER